MNAETLIAHLNLAPHPEGGFYRRTYSSPGNIPQAALPCGFRGARAFSTAILFLLRKGDYSRLHRIRQDELWHFYLGGPLRLALLEAQGSKAEAQEVLLGQNPLAGQRQPVRSARGSLVRGNAAPVRLFPGGLHCGPGL